MEKAGIGKLFARDFGALGLAMALCLAQGTLARAQTLECERLRAAIDATPRGDAGAAQAAGQLRLDIERLAAHADAIGCNNQQFLFFGSPPPPECGGIRQRLAGMRAQYDSLRVRGGDIGRRQALIAQYAQQCGGEPLPGEQPDEGPTESGGARGGGEALCVRKCDGYYFPLTPSMTSARAGKLRDLCQALCPDAEVGLYSRVASSDISTALSADSGERYSDLANALKYTKKLDPACACKKPKQGWAEILGRAEEILTEIEGERPGEGPLTPKQADDRSHAQPEPKVAEQAPPKPKKPKAKPAPTPVSPFDPPTPF
jgi:hypothetical protein